MKTPARLALFLATPLVALLAACGAPPLASDSGSGAYQPAASIPAPREPNADEQAELATLHKDYVAGRYGDVIKRVSQSQLIASAPDSVRIEALKLQAFSYCVRNYTRLCQDDFERILVIQPSFTLSQAEAGHPQWGPAYRKAREARTAAY